MLQTVENTASASVETANTPDWADIAIRICACDPSAIEDLYRSCHVGMRYFVRRQLGCEDDVDETVQQAFLDTITALQKNGIDDPRRLTGFLYTVLRRTIAKVIQRRVADRYQDRDESVDLLTAQDAGSAPFANALRGQNAALLTACLHQLRDGDRDLLVRAYLKEDSKEEIMTDLGIASHTYDLRKMRAKERLAKLFAKRQEAHKSAVSITGLVAHAAA